VTTGRIDCLICSTNSLLYFSSCIPLRLNEPKLMQNLFASSSKKTFRSGWPLTIEESDGPWVSVSLPRHFASGNLCLRRSSISPGLSLDLNSMQIWFGFIYFTMNSVASRTGVVPAGYPTTLTSRPRALDHFAEKSDIAGNWEFTSAVRNIPYFGLTPMPALFI
jgi:hypothetical protein